MSVIIPGMNMDHERVSIRPRNVCAPSLLDSHTCANWFNFWCNRSDVCDVLVRNSIPLHYRTMSHCWPGGRTRAQRAWLNFTTRRLCGMMTHNPTCSTSTAESLRPLSRISKSFTTTTVSSKPLHSVGVLYTCPVIFILNDGNYSTQQFDLMLKVTTGQSFQPVRMRVKSVLFI